MKKIYNTLEPLIFGTELAVGMAAVAFNIDWLFVSLMVVTLLQCYPIYRFTYRVLRRYMS